MFVLRACVVSVSVCSVRLSFFLCVKVADDSAAEVCDAASAVLGALLATNADECWRMLQVRDGASAVLSVLLDAFGADSMKKVLESLDDKKRKKVESLAAAGKDKVESVGAESGAGAGAGKPTAPTAGAPAPTVKLAAAKPPAKTVGADAAAGAASGSVPKRTVGKVAVSKPAGAAGAGAGAGAGKTKGADKPEAASEAADLNAGMPVEELDVHIETLFPEVG